MSIVFLHYLIVSNNLHSLDGIIHGTCQQIDAHGQCNDQSQFAAQHSGCKLGPLMVARQGVIQITAPASNETSDYGVYNTTTPQKVIRLVMTMEFELK